MRDADRALMFGRLETRLLESNCGLSGIHAQLDIVPLVFVDRDEEGMSVAIEGVLAEHVGNNLRCFALRLLKSDRPFVGVPLARPPRRSPGLAPRGMAPTPCVRTSSRHPEPHMQKPALAANSATPGEIFLYGYPFTPGPAKRPLTQGRSETPTRAGRNLRAVYVGSQSTQHWLGQ